jgi:hypothetical protein
MKEGVERCAFKKSLSLLSWLVKAGSSEINGYRMISLASIRKALAFRSAGEVLFFLISILFKSFRGLSNDLSTSICLAGDEVLIYVEIIFGSCSP